MADFGSPRPGAPDSGPRRVELAAIRQREGQVVHAAVFRVDLEGLPGRPPRPRASSMRSSDAAQGGDMLWGSSWQPARYLGFDGLVAQQGRASPAAGTIAGEIPCAARGPCRRTQGPLGCQARATRPRAWRAKGVVRITAGGVLEAQEPPRPYRRPTGRGRAKVSGGHLGCWQVPASTQQGRPGPALPSFRGKGRQIQFELDQPPGWPAMAAR